MNVKKTRLRVLTKKDYQYMLNISYKKARAWYDFDCNEHKVKGITCTLFERIYHISKEKKNTNPV